MKINIEKIRRQLETRNEYQKHAVQAYYDTEAKRFWFLVHDTMLLYADGAPAEYLKDRTESEILEYFRESILPKF